jgi:hypothetical protein
VDGDLHDLWEEVGFDEVQEEDVAEVEDEFEAEEGVELLVDGEPLVAEEAQEFLEGADDPLPG